MVNLTFLMKICTFLMLVLENLLTQNMVKEFVTRYVCANVIAQLWRIHCESGVIFSMVMIFFAAVKVSSNHQ